MVPDPFFSSAFFCKQKETSGVLTFYLASQVVSGLCGEDRWDVGCGKVSIHKVNLAGDVQPCGQGTLLPSSHAGL